MEYYDIAKYLLFGILGISGTAYLAENEMKNYDTIIEKPKRFVSIIVPSYNEGMLIEYCMQSIKSQNIIKQYPEMFEIILVDSGSNDGTLEKGRSYADKVITTPRGKLTARNRATDNAKGDIIVSVDSDSFYPDGWLNTLLKPFNKYNNIVGIAGSTIDYSISYRPGQIQTILHIFERIILRPKQMQGRNSAYLKDSFYKTGKFNENINQMDLEEMVMEEEVNFGERLSTQGDIMFLLNASCIHLGGLKIACRTNSEVQEKCELLGIGKDRF